MEKENNLIENICFVIAMILIVISISTYIKPLLNGGYDFGIVPEVLSLVLTIAAKKYLSKNELNNSMVCARAAVLLIVIILIYDIVQFIKVTENVQGEILSFIFEEGIFVVYITILSIASHRISKRMDLKILK